MSFSEAISKFNIGRIKSVAEKSFSSYVFPFVTGAVAVLSATFGLEPLAIWYICLCAAAISLCCKDISPVICLLVFMNIIISMQHSPDPRYGRGDPDYMTSPAFIAQASVAVVIFLSTVFYRIVDSIKKHRFKITPIFVGICFYVLALTLNGLFSSKYYFMDTIYSLGIGAIIIFLFIYISGNVEINEGTFKHIAVTFIAFSFALALQLLITYLTSDIVQDGVIIRYLIQFGWGTHSQFGVLIAMCIPAWFYLAAKCKNGYLFLIGVPFNLATAVMCMSRQAILMACVLAVICCIWYIIIVEKRQKIFGSLVLLVFAVAAVIILLINKDDFLEMFVALSESFESGNGRLDIWEYGLTEFLNNPIFGNGFYDLSATDANTPGFNGEGYGFTEAIPFMCHNTFVQLLFSCGIVGLIAYIFHRTQTIISLFNNPDSGRFFIMFTICGLLLTSLLDNHIFYPMPMFIYAPLLAILSASENTKGKGNLVKNNLTD